MTACVAAIYDIHGNIEALEAVLAEVEAEDVDLIVVGGDLAWGPFPGEVVARLRALGRPARFIRGNADREVAARAGEADGLDRWVAEVNLWCADQLTPDELGFLESLQESTSVDVDGIGDVLFCHATPQSDEDIVTPITPEEEVGALLTDVRQQVVVCGHTHSQFDRCVRDRRVVNAGSVGLPYEDAPGAYWAIIGPDVILKRTHYDVERAAARIKRSGCPDANAFAEAVTSPLRRDDAIQTFESRRR